MGERISHPLVAALGRAEEALFRHVGYAHDWRKFPIMDYTDMFWAVDPTEREWSRHSPSREALQDWVDTGEYRKCDGGMCYESEIYTYRHLDRWVVRGPELTIVLEDTHCDGNIWLAVYLTSIEVKAKGG